MIKVTAKQYKLVNVFNWKTFRFTKVEKLVHSEEFTTENKVEASNVIAWANEFGLGKLNEDAPRILERLLNRSVGAMHDQSIEISRSKLRSKRIVTVTVSPDND